ncbi:glycerol-3-phosphate acyltransferase [Anaerosoma tenue]|uniref:glycerol-3-phosphate acyltransferase n=1 Tax=Anaerosoma tenue TaxID=2933588 RepID=UPI002260C1F2|nr:glycerol-3-phosphate acyltransferase [Anaerosoma tenue]MCK8114005.1 glycerol-3-phosphate acyltransferase [Anaerosoma tenue]
MNIDALTSSSAWTSVLPLAVAWFAISYVLGSIPFAYIIVRAVTGEDITTHGTGNVGAMNVRRTTGSWGWFVVAMLADILKGVTPVAAAKILTGGDILTPVGVAMLTGDAGVGLVPMAAVAGAVVGHNYSAFMALLKKRFGRSGKGLATGAGALLAYDLRYFVAVVVIGLAVIALTRYMMAGQVVAAVTLPVAALVLRSPDLPFAVLMGALVYAAHHRRFVGLLKGQEPRFYIHDRGGPRG